MKVPLNTHAGPIIEFLLDQRPRALRLRTQGVAAEVDRSFAVRGFRSVKLLAKRTQGIGFVQAARKSLVGWKLRVGDRWSFRRAAHALTIVGADFKVVERDR